MVAEEDGVYQLAGLSAFKRRSRAETIRCW